MSSAKRLPASILEPLKSFDTPTISNAIETFRVRLRHEGFVHGALSCLTPELGPMVGYAVTGRIRSVTAPVSGFCYYTRMDFWEYVSRMPTPAIIVMEDVDHEPGVGALFGEIHVQISKALGCIGYVTNGSIRDLGGFAGAKFHAFAGSLAVSHSYAHIVEFGEPVEIGKLKICPGDVLHGDRHGLLKVPTAIAPQLAKAATDLLDREKELIQFVQSADFSVKALGCRLATECE